MRMAIYFYLCLAASSLGAQSASAQPKAARRDVTTKLEEFTREDPTLASDLAAAAGYAIFPGIGKVGIGLGGARGGGQVFAKGVPVADATLTQGSVGFQLGAQKYAELILFESQEALDRFMSGRFSFAAQVSAVAVKSGASANAKYADGVKVMTMAGAGLMYEASVGGQKFGVRKY